MKRIEFIGRLIGVLGIGGVSYVFAKFQGGFVSWFIFYMVLPFIVYSLLLAIYPLRDFTVRRQLQSEQVMRDGRVTIRLVIKRKWPFPLLYTVITDHRQFFEMKRSVEQIVLLGLRREYELTYTLQAIRRGEYSLPCVEIEVMDFFNWIRKRKVFPLHDSFLVYPKMTELFYESVSSGTSEGQQLSAYKLVKDAALPSSIREYASGDRLSWIHWKSFARTNKLMTKEFDEQQVDRYAVWIDCVASEMFEDVVEFTASLLEAGQHADVTLLLVDQPHIAIRSVDQMQRALVYLAKVQPRDEAAESIAVNYANNEDLLFVVTGNLRMDLIDQLLATYRKPSSIICFVAIDEDVLTEAFNALVTQIRKRGISVRLISRANRSMALKEAVIA